MLFIYIYIYIYNMLPMQVLLYLIFTQIYIAHDKMATFLEIEVTSEVYLHHKDVSAVENSSEGSLEHINKNKVFVLKKEAEDYF